MVGLSPVPAFPSYTGPYTVGTADIEVPLRELSPSLPSPDSKVDTISARIFYPCQPPAKTAAKAYWYPNPQAEYFSAYLRFLGTSQRLADFVSLFPRLLYYISLPATRNAGLLPAPTSSKRWPTMIFSHGLGGTRNMYSHVCGSLASHGVVVIAPEHRDGSAPISFVRDAEGKIAHTVQYQTISHDNTDATQLARRAQLEQRLWEIGETYGLAVKLDKGVIFSNHAITEREKKAAPEPDLAMFRDALDVQRPSAVHFAGHSFGAVTSLQFVKSVFYDPAEAPAGYQPLYAPPRDSPIVQQVTARSSLSLLDCWMLPTLDPSTAWLHDKPLPAYSAGAEGPGGKVILAVLSEGFYRWENNWKEQRRALSPDPRLDPSEWTEARLERVTAPRIFYPANSAHLSQSDFGVLFPWLAKKAFKAEDPARTIVLNVRAMLECWRNNGAEVASTSDKDMEIIEDAAKKEKEATTAKLREASKPTASRKKSDDTLTEEAASYAQDKAILLRDGSVRGWISLGLGQETTRDAVASEAAKGKDAGRIIKEKAQNGRA